MKKWKEKLIRWLGGYTSLIEAQPHTIVKSTAPLIKLRARYKMSYDFPEDKAYIERELIEKLVDSIVKNQMVMIDMNDDEVIATLYIADVREVR